MGARICDLPPVGQDWHTSIAQVLQLKSISNVHTSDASLQEHAAEPPTAELEQHVGGQLHETDASCPRSVAESEAAISMHRATNCTDMPRISPEP